MSSSRTSWTLGTAIALFLGVFIVPAQAYLDPATGSLILQAVVAGVLGALFAIKNFWSRIKNFVAGLFGKRADEISAEE